MSTLTRERSGQGLLEHLGYQPVNRYLPPRVAPVVPPPATVAPRGTLQAKLAALVNRLIQL